MFRHWRIQVSLICFTLLLAVIVLWVRSYTWDDQLIWSSKSKSYLWIVSVLGGVYFVSGELPTGSPPTDDVGWRMASEHLTKQMKDDVYSFRVDHCIRFLEFIAIFASNATYLGVPYWFISVFFALLCGLPWYWRRFNFGLRTFFIAFTVLALVLGFIGWLTR